MKIEGINNLDVEANRSEDKNDKDENGQNRINESEEKTPKNLNSNLKKLASMAEPIFEPVKTIGGALGQGGFKLADSLLKVS